MTSVRKQAEVAMLPANITTFQSFQVSRPNVAKVCVWTMSD